MKRIFLFFLGFSTQIAFSQQALQNKILKMEAELHDYDSQDTIQYKMLDDLSWELRRSDPVKSLSYAQEALKLAIELGYQKGIGTSMNMVGIVYNNQGDFEHALEWYLKALKERQKLGDKKSIGNTLDNIGIVYEKLGNYGKAIEYELEALKIREEVQDKSGLASGFNQIGLIHKKQKNFDKALEYLNKALELEKELGDKNGMAINYNNIGNTYYDLQDYPKARELYNKSLEIRKELNDKRGLSSNYSGLGNVSLKEKNIPSALEYFVNSIELSKEIGDKEQTSIIYNRIGRTLTEIGDYKKAINYSIKSLDIAKEIGSLEIQKNDYSLLSEIYEQDSKLEGVIEKKVTLLQQALEYYKKYYEINEDILSNENIRQIAELQSKYELEKSRYELEKRELEAEKFENERKVLVSISTGSFMVLLLALVLLYVLVKSNRTRHRINQNLSKANQDIQKKNEDITASINYALRIQKSMFPEMSILDNLLQDYFILLKPRDIVSGDFYWFSQTDEKLVITAVDCTGHGVPGAFMSMIGFEQLTEIVNLNKIVDADKILNTLNLSIKQILKQEDGENKDGMDLALCVIDKETQTLEFAGAKNPLVYISSPNGKEPELNIIKGDKMPIGGQQHRTHPFTKHTIPFDGNTSFYIFSDGYQDQFGGPENRKFMIKNLKKLLLSIHHLPMAEQKEILEQTLEGWMGSRDQIDDILVMGFKV